MCQRKEDWLKILRNPCGANLALLANIKGLLYQLHKVPSRGFSCLALKRKRGWENIDSASSWLWVSVCQQSALPTSCQTVWAKTSAEEQQVTDTESTGISPSRRQGRWWCVCEWRKDWWCSKQPCHLYQQAQAEEENNVQVLKRKKSLWFNAESCSWSCITTEKFRPHSNSREHPHIDTPFSNLTFTSCEHYCTISQATWLPI